MKNYVSSWQQSSQPLPVTGQSRVCTRHNTTVRSTQRRNKWLHATCLRRDGNRTHSHCALFGPNATSRAAAAATTTATTTTINTFTATFTFTWSWLITLKQTNLLCRITQLLQHQYQWTELWLPVTQPTLSKYWRDISQINYSMMLSNRSAQVWHVLSRDFTSFTCTHTHVHLQSEWAILPFCLCLPIYQPRRDGRLSRPWCEVAPVQDSNRQPPDCKSGTLPHSH